MTTTKKKILIIDDDDFIREMLAEHLSENGYQVHEAVDGSDGVKQILKIMPDVVLLDLHMPKLDGLSVLELLFINAPEIPVIIVSGQGTMEDVIKSLRLGAWDYLLKPIQNFDLLNNSIDKVLERSSLIKENRESKEKLEHLNKELELKVKKRTLLLKSTLFDLNNANTSLKKQNVESFQILSKIIEMRPGIYKGYSKFVVEKSVLLAKEMGCDDTEIQTMMVAGLLLQIGKLGLPEKMLTKPFYLLDKTEKQNYLHHAVAGQKLLKGMAHLKDAAYLIRCQHENFSGTGVPDGLKGDQIPLPARIFKVIQDYFTYYHGMTTGKKMNSMAECFEKMKRFSDKYYDPKILQLYVVLATGGPYYTQKLVIETDWYKIQPGMHIVIVKHKDMVYLKNKPATKDLIQHIKELRETLGAGLVIKVQVR